VVIPTARPPYPYFGIARTSLYIPRAAYRKVKEIAIASDRRPHDVIMEGIDLVLAKYGCPSLAKLTADSIEEEVRSGSGAGHSLAKLKEVSIEEEVRSRSGAGKNVP
jgi:hypothetical protein